MLDAEKISITNFNIVKGQVESPFDFNRKIVKGYDFDVNFSLGFDSQNKLVKADFEVSISTESKEKQEEATGFFHFVCIYQVENLDELIIIKHQEKEIEVNGDLNNALASISYSTARGILMTRFQGTALNNFILPVVSPDRLINNLD